MNNDTTYAESEKRKRVSFHVDKKLPKSGAKIGLYSYRFPLLDDSLWISIFEIDRPVSTVGKKSRGLTKIE